jgi:hypothetical protein
MLDAVQTSATAHCLDRDDAMTISCIETTAEDTDDSLRRF